MIRAQRPALRLGRRMRGPADGESFRLQREHAAGQPVTIPVDSLTHNVCIFGRTGSGKSVTANVIASELLRAGGVAVLVLDRTGELAHSSLATQPGAEVLDPRINLRVSPFARTSRTAIGSGLRIPRKNPDRKVWWRQAVRLHEVS